jgi:hypothetical protein
MNKPIKEKYLDEHFGPYHIFGTHTNGEVDIMSNGLDVITLPIEDAEKVVQYHKEFMEKVYKLLGYDLKTETDKWVKQQAEDFKNKTGIFKSEV